MPHEDCLSTSLRPRRLFEASSEPSLHQPLAPCENGGAELPEPVREITEDEDHDGPVPGHRQLQQEFYKPSKGRFRLQSKAFMMTFNSILFERSTLNRLEPNGTK